MQYRMLALASAAVLAGCAAKSQSEGGGGGTPAKASTAPATRSFTMVGQGRLEFSGRPADAVQQFTLTLRDDGLFEMKILGSLTYDMAGNYRGTEPNINLEARSGFDGSLSDARGTLLLPESGVGQLDMTGTAYGGRFRFVFSGRVQK